MTSVHEMRKKAAARATAKKQMYSTSQARANFAEALGIAQTENTVIGFDRYGRLVAAVVPIDAVRMLAGQAGSVEPGVRDKIERMSKLFLNGARVAAEAPAPRAERGVREARASFSRSASKKDKAGSKKDKPGKSETKAKDKRKDKKRKKSKAQNAKRGPRISKI